jgi:hypothetical protein
MQNLCGVDISKDWLDSFIDPNYFERFENSPEGIGPGHGFLRQSVALSIV